MIRFRCPVCARTIKVPEACAGRQVVCPRCNATVGAPLAGLDSRGETPEEAPGFFASMSPRMRLFAGSVASATGAALLTAVLGGVLEAPAWVTHGAVLATIGSAILLFTGLHGHGTGCPRCGRWWSRMMVRSEVGERETFERDGMTFARSVTRAEYRCQGCGHKWSVTDSEEYRVTEPRRPQKARK